MADVNSPVEFLDELLSVTGSLDDAKEELKKCRDAKKRHEGDISSLKNAAEKEKADTIKNRLSDLKAGYDKQIRSLDKEIKSISDKRRKELNSQMKKRKAEATKESRQQSSDSKKAFKDYAAEHRMPVYMRGRAYYSLFCPGVIGYIVLVLLFAAILITSFWFARGVIAAGEGAVPFIVIGIIDILLLFAYVFAWSNTRVKYRDEISECLNIIKGIKAAENSTRKIERDIQRAGDDKTYDLSNFDMQLAEKNAEKAETESKKAAAVEEFETVTRKSITDNIDENYRPKLEAAGQGVSSAEAEEESLNAKIKELEGRISTEFVPHVGSSNIKREKIVRLKAIIEEGGASSISEAVEKLEAGSKK